MISDLDGLKEYFSKRDYSTYERDNFDKFLKEMHFSFDKKSIHITGTNGKGSTANFIRDIYLANGQKVGLFMSPFLFSPLEMISVDGIDISLQDYLSILNRYGDRFAECRLSSFEIQTFIAFIYFADQNVDIAVVETGMGGYLDATNCFIPSLSIITTVSLEHTGYLGRTVSEIADSKSGIIKDDTPVLIGKLSEDAEYPILLKTKRCDAPLYRVDDYHAEVLHDNRYYSFDYKPYKGLIINTPADYQLLNACLAVEAVKILMDVIYVSEGAIKTGLAMPTLPSRFEFFAPNIIIDGAHNPEAMDALMVAIQKVANGKAIRVLFAVFKDKNIDLMLTSLNRETSEVVITTFDHKRARTEENYFLYLDDYHFDSDFRHALKEYTTKYPDDIILVTGSLAFSNVVRQYLLSEDKR
ncbi:MAG: Mur ligase family protein [Bacilli bacterium]|jgi:dihydrofolate synthase/folylpolyglutamate synthase